MYESRRLQRDPTPEPPDAIAILALDPIEAPTLRKSTRHSRPPDRLLLRELFDIFLALPTRGLFFRIGSPLTLTTSSDADRAGCPDTHRSTTGR